ncbi:hypothetical protein QCA50_018936 [Cerrena zonata]|uniref:Major facilitator superfamily (MFS) profile domain-containing protein n=1 Tax=Cerrena zonata TaxID=2478898 RepID=A0AAW0FDH1_9APHY
MQGTMYSDKDSSGHSSSRVVSGDNTNVKDEDAFAPATSWLGTVEERRLVRKLDMRIMPLTCILYLFAFLDRTNIGNARLQGLPEDTLHGDPAGTLFDWVTSAFFFSYILCQIPATVISKLFPPRVWLGCAIIGWGLSSTLMSTAFNFQVYSSLESSWASSKQASAPLFLYTTVSILVLHSLAFDRLVYADPIIRCKAFWYTKHEMGTRMAYWFGFSAVSGAFGGLIAFGIQHAHAAISNWRLLFIVEGVPTVLLGFLTLWLLPDRPEETSTFETGRCKEACLRCVRDWRIYVAGIIQFGANCSLVSILAFLPTIIKTFGVSNAKAQLLTVPPYAVSAAVLIILSYFSDRFQSRGIPLSCAASIGAIGYLLLLTVHENQHVRYFAVFCITSGTYTFIGILIAWTAHNFGSETKKATGLPMYMSIGQCGSVLGSHIFPATEGPRYIKGFAITCALEFLAAICGIILTISYRIENKRRDKKHGRPDPDATVDTTELADKAPMF